MDKFFNINFRKIGIEYMPTFLRTYFWIPFHLMLISPLDRLFLEVLRSRKQNLIRITTTCQKFSMQKRLNDLFDPIERRIHITKPILFDSTYLYTEAEDDPYYSKTRWLFDDSNPIYLRTEAELYSEFDFFVKIPNSGIKEIQLRAEIEYYMLQSKNYKIIII